MASTRRRRTGEQCPTCKKRAAGQNVPIIHRYDCREFLAVWNAAPDRNKAPAMASVY